MSDSDAAEGLFLKAQRKPMNIIVIFDTDYHMHTYTHTHIYVLIYRKCFHAECFFPTS